WPAAHAYLPDDVNNPRRLLSSPVWHFEREDLTPLALETAGAVLEIGQGLPGKSESREPRMPILLKPRKRLLLKHGLHAAFGFPLYAEGKLQAVLEFFSDTPQLPDRHLLYIVQGIGEQLGRVLERQQNREQQRQARARSDTLTRTNTASE